MTGNPRPSSAGLNADSRRWRLQSRQIDVVVEASDQWEAWDTLRDRSALEFGLIVLAEPDESADPIPVHTETLMRRWGRQLEADAFLEVAVAAGLKDRV